MSLIEKLRKFDSFFFDKSRINLAEAKQYLEDAFGKTLDDDYVYSFLDALGYKEILPPENTMNTVNEDDLELDDIINLDWESKAKKIADQPHEQNKLNLSRYYHHKDSEAFEQLVESNMNLVRKIAKKYINFVSHDLSFDDLVSEGTIGLMKAIQRFDITRGLQFSTYAVWWIRQQIMRAIMVSGTTVRVPIHMFERIMKIKREELNYGLNGELHKVDEICKKLSISPEAYRQAKLAEHRFLSIPSLDQYVSDDDLETELGHFVSPSTHMLSTDYDASFYDPTIIVERNDIRTTMMEIIAEHLEPRERIIILERFGFINDEPKTLEQLGQRFGLTRERIRQIEAKVLKKLKVKILKNASYEDFVWPETAAGGWL